MPTVEYPNNLKPLVSVMTEKYFIIKSKKLKNGNELLVNDGATKYYLILDFQGFKNFRFNKNDRFKAQIKIEQVMNVISFSLITKTYVRKIIYYHTQCYRDYTDI